MKITQTDSSEVKIFNIEFKQDHFSDSVKNLTGTFIYLFCQWLMLIIVIRIAGYFISGEYSLVITFTNIFGFLSMYNIRSLQLSDTECHFSPQQYSAAYIITSSAAVVCFFIALPFCGYSINVNICSIAFIFYKLCEAFTAYIFTYMQLNNKYSNIMISFIFKGIFPLAGFSLTLYVTNSLFYSIIIMLILYFFILSFYDLRIIKKYFPIGIKINGVKQILIKCFPLMLSSLFTPVMLFILRHTIEYIFGTTELGLFSPFTMVIVILSALTGAVVIVLIPAISKSYLENNKKMLLKMIITMIFGLVFFTIISIIVSIFFGDFIFEIIFGIEVLSYMYLLIPVILAGSLMAVSLIFSTFLIAIKKRISMLLCFLSGEIIFGISALPVTQKFGLLGITNTFSISILIIILFQIILIIININKLKKI